jgi:hypothetical protein
MILTSYLMGGLGNQMFQIAKAVSEGLSNNIKVGFQKSAFIPMHGNQPTKYLTNIFRNVNFVDTLPNTFRVSEPTWAYYKLNITYDKPIEFYGYFQSSKNFNGHGDYLKYMFSPTTEFVNKINNLYPKIGNGNIISIHVRRGDYLGISDVLPVIDKSYIDECLNRIGDYDKIYIFSNDKEWCEQNLNYEKSEIIYGLEDYEELWMMSLCNNNIMSNSSFSWWGSYLNKNKNKKIYCPSVWFGPKGEKNYEDIYEDNWIKINVKYNNGLLTCVY